MNPKQLPFFGEIKENSEFLYPNLSGPTSNAISLSLYTDNNIDEDRTKKIASILKNMDALIELAKNTIISTALEGGFYANTLAEHKDFIFYECLRVKPDDYSELFSECYKNVSLVSFAKALILKHITLAYDSNSVTLDYYFPLDNNAIWAVKFNLDLQFETMLGES